MMTDHTEVVAFCDAASPDLMTPREKSMLTSMKSSDPLTLRQQRVLDVIHRKCKTKAKSKKPTTKGTRQWD